MKKKDRDCEVESLLLIIINKLTIWLLKKKKKNEHNIKHSSCKKHSKVQYLVTIINTNVPFKYNYFLAADLSNKSLKLNSSPVLEIFRKSEA